MIDETKRIKRAQIIYETNDEMDAFEELYAREVEGYQNIAVAEVAKMKKRPPSSFKYIVFKILKL